MSIGRTALLLLLAAAEPVLADPSDEYGEKQPIRRRQITKEELDASAKRLALEAVRMASAGLHPVEWALPMPLRGEDGGFSLESVKVRLPEIARTVIKNNPGYVPVLVSSLEDLAKEVASNEKLRMLDRDSQISPEALRIWEEVLNLNGVPLAVDERGTAIKKRTASVPTWFSAPWFMIENYFYKRVLQLTDRFCPLCDPFAAQKLAALSAAEPAFKRMIQSGMSETDDLELLVYTSLWGNLADLSFSAGDTDEGSRHYGLSSAKTASQLASSGGKLLADDSAALVKLMRRLEGKDIVIVLDNGGLELMSDLLLIDGLLRIVKPSTITLHVKDRPAFVSDATIADVPLHIEKVEQLGANEMAWRLRNALASGQLRIEAPDFYTSPLPWWQMPDSLRTQFKASGLVITKGDANFRRLVGDRHWPNDLPFSELMQSYWPTSIAALRTCKSNIVIGVDKKQEAAAKAATENEGSEHWLVGGIYGHVSLSTFKNMKPPPEEDPDNFLAQVQKKLKDWWALTPWRYGLEACFSTFSVLLARLLQKQPPPTPALATADHCDWVAEGAAAGALDLPDFPHLPDEFRAPVIPIPQLLEWWLLDEWRTTRREDGGTELVAVATIGARGAEAELLGAAVRAAVRAAMGGAQAPQAAQQPLAAWTRQQTPLGSLAAAGAARAPSAAAQQAPDVATVALAASAGAGGAVLGMALVLGLARFGAGRVGIVRSR